MSQLTDYVDCGLAYRLERVEKAVSEIPAWWTVGGNAFHRGVEEYERARVLAGNDPEPIGWEPNDAAKRYRSLLSEEIAKQVAAYPDVKVSTWRSANQGKEGAAWWEDKGPEMLAQYVIKAKDRPERVLELGDVLALELDFTTELGGIPVRMIVDQVLWHPARQLVIVRDLKTGSRMPGDPVQLQAYADGIRHAFGLPANAAGIVGRYWDARKATDVGERDLTHPDAIAATAARFVEFDRAERLGIYTARPSNFCVSCSARSVCPIMRSVPTSRKEEARLTFEA